jgi:isoquinoline 1-oxidoreductase beta subunit
MEGGVGFGLGHALYGEIELGEGGQVEQHNFDGYRSLRMSEMPEVEVVIVKSAENPTGVGEPGLPPLAPAVANAWRNLTGKVVNRLPFSHGENA